jgi:hypothetical protein
MFKTKKILTKLSFFKKHTYLVANRYYSTPRWNETVLADIYPLSKVPYPTSSFNTSLKQFYTVSTNPVSNDPASTVPVSTVPSSSSESIPSKSNISPSQLNVSKATSMSIGVIDIPGIFESPVPVSNNSNKVKTSKNLTFYIDMVGNFKISADILRELEKLFLECIDKNIISNDHIYNIEIFLVSDTMPNVVIALKEQIRMKAYY